MQMGCDKMATKTITVRVDEDVKNQAEVILDDIGLTVTTLFNACLKAVVREKKIPFALVSREYELQKMIREKLEESQDVASDIHAKRYTHDEIFRPLREKYGYEVQN
jgi:DNA-damage-inducible protein J